MSDSTEMRLETPASLACQLVAAVYSTFIR